MKILFKITICFLAFSTTLIAQDYKKRFNAIDIQNYKLTLAVNDSTNNIYATMEVTLKFKIKSSKFELDLIEKDSTGNGMIVHSIMQKKDNVAFKHLNNKITIYPSSTRLDSIFSYTINYSGIPKDGLIISKNMYGNRTFFGDNWPNRAQNWFPCVDHPSDKATIEYIVKAPNHYQVIANGFQVEETNLPNYLKQYHYKTSVPLPTKLMVVGIAEFAVQNIGETHNIPVSTWVYPQTKEKGFYDFVIAKEVLNFFIENVGEYPFDKLANVQSKTKFGGMENAGAIFYYENAVTGERNHENLIAHEISHQWFGDSVTEINWPHVWLSEGFATYFTHLYVLNTKGEEVFKERMKDDRKDVLAFYKQQKTPVIDYESTNLMSILNTNSYQKGGWFLHMLRKKIGDEFFWKGIKEYYEKYKLQNASTNNLKNVMAETSNQNLDIFFKQWLENSGHPRIKTNWVNNKNKVLLIIDQTQETNFLFPIDVELKYVDGSSEIKTIQINHKSAPYEIPTNQEVVEIILDPNSWLLFEEI